MPNFSGIWTVTQQMQARGASTWPQPPGAPTIGTATGGDTSASVTFTAPSCTGYPAGVTGYRVISTPGCFSNTGASSPIVVSGLTNGTPYTFKAQATNVSGYGALSAASNSVTPTLPTGSQAYTSATTYTWVAPAGVTKVSVVAIGGGGGGGGSCAYSNGIGGQGGGGGALAYSNNISVTPGNSYAVVVGAAGRGAYGICYCGFACNTPRVNATASTFNTTTVSAGGGKSGCSGSVSTGNCGGTVIYGTGYAGGKGGSNACASPFGSGSGAGGAGGYSGVGGAGGKGNGKNNGAPSGTGCSGSGGSGGGGGGGNRAAGGSGGGVGICGQGSSGSGGAGSCNGIGGCGTAGSGGSGQSYGGGGGGRKNQSQLAGSVGAVRIIWPGNIRSFPSTCAGAP